MNTNKRKSIQKTLKEIKGTRNETTTYFDLKTYAKLKFHYYCHYKQQ